MSAALALVEPTPLTFPDPAQAQNSKLEGLLFATARKDREAFRELYELTSRSLFSIILAMVRHREVAEEVAQDTFVTIWQRAGQFDSSRGRPLAWLTTIARNRAIDRLRRERAKTRETIDVEDCSELEEQLSTGPKFDIEAYAVRRALGQLKAEYRTALILAYFRGCTHAEIADTMNVPLGTAKCWVRRGLVRLQELL
ncbi:MAG: sigma-70 family RNA polymerase sigma factor [Pseudomonadota bacterium]